MLFSGIAEVCEWYDDEEQAFKISVEVHNKTWGRLFGYKGSFQVEYLPIESVEIIPKEALPIREEIRE